MTICQTIRSDVGSGRIVPPIRRRVKSQKYNVTRLIEIFRSVRTLPLAVLECHVRRIFISSGYS